jgi:hypothetical protein
MITFSKASHGGINVFLNGEWVAWAPGMRGAKVLAQKYA